jgi:hypothetical protein
MRGSMPYIWRLALQCTSAVALAISTTLGLHFTHICHPQSAAKENGSEGPFLLACGEKSTVDAVSFPLAE